MDNRIVRAGDIFIYDPRTQLYTSGSPITTISGSPAISSSKLRLNAAVIQSQTAMTFGTLELVLNIPTAPTVGDAREFGLYFMNYGNKARMTFQISGTTFGVSVYDSAGTQTSLITCTWNSAWTATDTRFSIYRAERRIIFKANNTILYTLDDADLLPKYPITFYVSNTNADNLDLAAVSIYGL